MSVTPLPRPSTLTADVPPPEQRQRRRLGEVLVSLGLLTPEQLKDALREQHRGGRRRRLGEVLTELNMLTERQLAGALAEALNLELVDLSQIPIRIDDVRLLPRKVADRHCLMVIGHVGAALKVAVADPTNVVALDDVRLATRTPDLIVVVAMAREIREHVARAWATHGVSEVVLVDDSEAVEDDISDVADAPIVKLASQIFADAVHLAASDVHLEPQQRELRVRFRIDGMLREIMTVPRSSASTLIGRVKVMAGLDIAERRRPQDGRTRLQLDDAFVDARVSTLPTLYGEKVVVRLLPRAAKVPALPELGIEPDQLGLLHRILAEPQGLVLITGPTGSGKTNTMYAALQHLRSEERNIVTLEDPIEIEQPGIAQVQVHEKAGMTFARGLRAVLRQDPDIVLVGEVRDPETAELALRASMTGHLVLTTLHTNDAAAAITRLVDMGVPPYLVASSLTLVVAQRLVRRPCPDCAVDDEPAEHVLDGLGLLRPDLAQATPRRGRGCPDCGHTGYRGRVGVYELLPITASMRRTLLTTPTEQAIRAAAGEAGVRSLRATALAKASRGETTYDEVLRATREDAGDGVRCPGCERVLADDMVGCPWCGADVDEHTCSRCGHRMQAEWVRCPFCKPVPAQRRRRTDTDGEGATKRETAPAAKSSRKSSSRGGRST